MAQIQDLSTEMQEYVQYIQTTLNKYRAIALLAKDGDDNLTPREVNTALADFMPTYWGLIAEYNVAKAQHNTRKEAFDRWYDRTFMEVRKTLLEELPENSKAKPALKEYETKLKVDYEEDYYRYKRMVEIAEFKERYLLRLTESMSRYDRILANISQNMRSEMMSLSLENRTNRVHTSDFLTIIEEKPSKRVTRRIAVDEK